MRTATRSLTSMTRASVPYPFNTRQYARLLVLRSRLEERMAREDDLDTAA
jgi:hypothetical protein